ncbi:tRNA (adenine(22)-N(1))-methyltransferase TrmK [Candidatus Phytoplasma sacchari]
MKPLNNAKLTLKKYPVDFYLTDGFNDINYDFDLALICGMGPHTIINILEKTNFYNKHFLLGCQGKIIYLINWLQKNNFDILKSYELLDKFSYSFLKVIRYQ